MIQTVLVTGAYGFLGRHVALVCAKAGYKVHGIGHGSWTSEQWREWGLSKWHSADVTQDSLERYGGEPDLIIHCAGSGSVSFSISHPSEDFDRTVATAREILEYARLCRPGVHVVFPSSASVYGNAKQNPISVTAPLQPISPYGTHKLIVEELSLSYAIHFNISVAIVRLFSIYGIGLKKQLLWDACTKFSLGECNFGGSGHETRDWLHVEDAAQLLLTAGLDEHKNPLIINGATGVGVTTCHIINNIALSFGLADKVSFSGNTRPGDPLHLVADMSGFDEIKWKPSRNLDHELACYINWYRTEKS